MTPNLYLSGTLNPDFSQVEADAAQLDVNQPFALFYAEKRPFFTEGADFFKTPLSVTYTRTLRDPQWGLRLSGKEAANAIGAFLVEDRLTNLIFPGSQSSAATSLQQHSTAASLRYSRDVGRSSSLGLAVTSRSGGDYFNRVYGADGTLRFSPKDELELQALGSSTRYDDATAEAFAQPAGEFHDKALSARYVRKSRYHRVELGYLDIGPEFRADLGFLPQVGLRRFSAVSEHEWIPKTSGWWSRFRLSNAARYSSEQGGPLLDKALDNQLSYEGPLQSQLSIGNQLSRQLYNGVEFGLSSWRASVFVQPTGAVGLYLPTSFGDGIDFANTRKGSRWRIAPSLTLNLGRHLRLDLGHTYERMSVAGARLYTAHLSEGAALYHFNARTFLRAIVQYYDYEYNVENYLQPREPVSRQLFTQLLFSYKLNARTVLFVGYSDNGFGSADFGVTRTDYTLFVKLGYAWVL
jgi:hypothetical protein